MGNTASQANARGLREILTGLNRIEQHRAAAAWAVANNRTNSSNRCGNNKIARCIRGISCQIRHLKVSDYPEVFSAHPLAGQPPADINPRHTLPRCVGDFW